MNVNKVDLWLFRLSFLDVVLWRAEIYEWKSVFFLVYSALTFELCEQLVVVTIKKQV